MGLEAVELVMDVEDHFGISIRDTEAETIRTVGELVSLIQSRLVAARQTPCPARRAFLSLRHCVRGVTGNERLRIRPRQLVTDVLDNPQRRELWAQLSTLLGTTPRGLRRPPWLRRTLGATSLALLVAAIIYALKIDVATLPVTLAGVGIIVSLLWILTLRCRTIPPHEWSTFGAIALKVTGVVAATKRVTLETKDEILNELRPLMVNVLGVDADEVEPEARFVEDLGLG